MTTTFFRLLKDTDKAAALGAALSAYRQGAIDADRTFRVDPAAFAKVPNTPFAYWVDDSIRDLFQKLPPFESEGRTVKQGLATADDFRFVRAWWEVNPATRLDPGLGGAPDWRTNLEAFQSWCRARTRQGKGWAPFAKGGEYSPYYSDIHLVVNWQREGEEIKNFVDPKTGKQNSRPQNTDYYFRPGVTWPERTTSGFSPQVLAAGVVFSHVGELYWSPQVWESALAVLTSNMRVMSYLIEVLIGSGDSTVSGSAGRHYTTGLVGKLPLIGCLLKEGEIVANTFLREVYPVPREMAQWDSSQLVFSLVVPTCNKSLTETIHGRYGKWLKLYVGAIDTLTAAEVSLFQNALLNDTISQSIENEEGRSPFLISKEPVGTETESIVRDLITIPIDALVDRITESIGKHRWTTKKSYMFDRRLELISLSLDRAVSTVIESIRRHRLVPPDVVEKIVVSVSDSMIGLVFARYDIRLALNPDLIPALPDPFDPLPVVPPATLVGPDGLLATSGCIVSEEWLRARPNAITLPPAGSVTQATIADAEYPIEVPWDGLLVDEPEHPADIVARVQRVLTVLHGERADAVEEELLKEVGFQSLREYLSKPNGFFDAHLKRYSKSRRKAPIYWPLATKSGGWTVWIYYPRLADKTLYTIIDRYLRPRRDAVKRLYEAVAAVPPASRSKVQQQAFDLYARDAEELATMETELKRVADAGYRVNHDDGVPILAAPLHTLFRHAGWSGYLSGIYRSMEEGEYDWAHLSYALWPARVRQSAQRDRSIAIAHGLEGRA